jgi:hypothetical protein
MPPGYPISRLHPSSARARMIVHGLAQGRNVLNCRASRVIQDKVSSQYKSGHRSAPQRIGKYSRSSCIERRRSSRWARPRLPESRALSAVDWRTSNGKAPAQQTHRAMSPPSPGTHEQLPERALAAQGARVSWFNALATSIHFPRVRSRAWARRMRRGKRAGAGVFCKWVHVSGALGCTTRLARTCTCLFADGAASPSVRWARAAGLAVQHDGEGGIAICGVSTGPFNYPLYHMYATVRPHKS